MVKNNTLWKRKEGDENIYKIIDFWIESSPCHHLDNICSPYFVIVLQNTITGKDFALAENILYDNYKKVG